MTNQPLHDPQTEQRHDRLDALKQRLETDFPPAFSSDADAEKTISWIASNIDKGLCRIFAIHINECAARRPASLRLVRTARTSQTFFLQRGSGMIQ